MFLTAYLQVNDCIQILCHFILLALVPPIQKAPQNEVLRTLLYSLLPLISITILVAVVFWLYKKRKSSLHQPLPSDDPLGNHHVLPQNNINILENSEQFKPLQRIGKLLSKTLINYKFPQA